MSNLITLLIVLGLPALLMWAEKHVKLIKWVSPIILCYVAGIVIANKSILDPGQDLLDNTTGIAVGLAIPLLLFSTNLKKWLGQASKALLSFGIGIVGVLLASTLAYFIFSGSVDEANKVSGMMVGVYSGGTPNMAAIGKAVDVKDEVFALLNGADVIISGVYFIFLLAFAKPLLGKIMPKFRSSKNLEEANGSFNLNDLRGHSFKCNLKKILAGVGLAALVLGLAFGMAELFIAEGKSDPWIILIITTAAIALSFIPKVRNLRGTYKSAEYLLLVFAVAIGCMADLKELLEAGPQLFLFCGFVVFASIIFHYAGAALFKIDVDTVIITSTAAIYGPAFVGPVANAIKNPKVIVSGITMGLLGYSLANYLGQGIAGLLGLL